jgi:hypothetical protein
VKAVLNEERIMTKKWLVKAAFAAGVMYASTGTAYAACGGNGQIGTYNGTFWSWYTDNSSNNGGYGGNDCMTVENANNASVKKAKAYWYIDDGANDVVGGVGWSTGFTTGTIRYKYNSFVTNYNSRTNNSDGTKAWGALYGWSCQTKRVNNQTVANPQEYYVVENYDGSSYVPFNNGKLDSRGRLAPGPADKFTSKTINNVDYDIYITRQPNAAHACAGGTTEFYQYWSVARAKRFSGDISIADHISAWESNSGGFLKAGMGTANAYQVMGLEGVINSTGSAEWTVERP